MLYNTDTTARTPRAYERGQQGSMVIDTNSSYFDTWRANNPMYLYTISNGKRSEDIYAIDEEDALMYASELLQCRNDDNFTIISVFPIF